MEGASGVFGNGQEQESKNAAALVTCLPGDLVTEGGLGTPEAADCEGHWDKNLEWLANLGQEERETPRECLSRS